VVKHRDFLPRRFKTLDVGRLLNSLGKFYVGRAKEISIVVNAISKCFIHHWLLHELFIYWNDWKQLSQKQKIWSEIRDTIQEIVSIVELQPRKLTIDQTEQFYLKKSTVSRIFILVVSRIQSELSYEKPLRKCKSLSSEKKITKTDLVMFKMSEL
jgi:hypothetical protein